MSALTKLKTITIYKKKNEISLMCLKVLIFHMASAKFTCMRYVRLATSPSLIIYMTQKISVINLSDNATTNFLYPVIISRFAIRGIRAIKNLFHIFFNITWGTCSKSSDMYIDAMQWSTLWTICDHLCIIVYDDNGAPTKYNYTCLYHIRLQSLRNELFYMKKHNHQ